MVAGWLESRAPNMRVLHPSFTIEPLTSAHSEWVESFVRDHWHGDSIVVHGQSFSPHRLPGFVATLNGGRTGLVTYSVEDSGCEIITLDSLRPRAGIGAALLEAVKTAAEQARCARLWLTTTNDNLSALGFYQKRGFKLVAVHYGAVARARLIKPSIPLVGDNGMPICDELELELVLRAARATQ